MRSILITGASGFIGSNLVRRLSSSYTLYTPPQKELDLSTQFSTGNLPKKLDAIIHLANSRHFKDFPKCADETFSINVSSTSRLLDYAIESGVKTFVLASTGGIYGYGKYGFNEADSKRMRSGIGFYAGCKLCSEIIASNYTDYMNVIVLRFFFVYGPKQKNSMLIPRLIDSIKKGTSINLKGRSGININPIYISDATCAIEKALNLGTSHIINIGGPESLSLRSISDEIGRTIGKVPNFIIEPSLQENNLIGNIGKMCSLLGEPNVNFKEGIRMMLESGV